jgi:hypothetical protein
VHRLFGRVESDLLQRPGRDWGAMVHQGLSIDRKVEWCQAGSPQRPVGVSGGGEGQPEGEEGQEPSFDTFGTMHLPWVIQQD